MLYTILLYTHYTVAAVGEAFSQIAVQLRVGFFSDLAANGENGNVGLLAGGWQLASYSALATGVVVALSCYFVVQKFRRVDAEKLINPFEVGGIAACFIPVVRLLHSAEVAVFGHHTDGQGTAPVGCVFRALNCLDRLATR